MASEVVMVGPQRQRLFELTLLVRQAAQPQLVINAPFGIHVGQGLELLIDGEPGGRVPILYCAQSGCRAEMQMTSELIERMSAGHILSLVFLANGGQRVTTPVPLTGFASAYHRIKLDGDAVAATGDKDAASDPKR